MTTQEIMKLADDYAETRVKLNEEKRISLRSERTLDACEMVDKSRAALQTALEAQAAEIERLNEGWHKANQEALKEKLTVKDQAKDIVLLCDDLKYIAGIARRAGMPVDEDNLKVRAAILGAVQILEAERDTLQARLDALEKQEPVATVEVREEGGDQHLVVILSLDHNWQHGHKLYAAPKALEPLTFRQIAEATNEFAEIPSDKTIGIARAIEAAHGIGGKQP